MNVYLNGKQRVLSLDSTLSHCAQLRCHALLLLVFLTFPLPPPPPPPAVLILKLLASKNPPLLLTGDVRGRWDWWKVAGPGEFSMRLERGTGQLGWGVIW